MVLYFQCSVTNDIKRLFICLSAIHPFSLVEHVQIVGPCLNWVIAFLLNCKSSPYIPDTVFRQIFVLHILFPSIQTAFYFLNGVF